MTGAIQKEKPMKLTFLKLFLVVPLMGLGVSSLVFSKNMDHSPYKGSAEFEKLKGLVGNWEGTSKMGEKEHPATVSYKLTAADSALVETLFEGTPHEMVTLYHDNDGKLELTHYCALANQPQMSLRKSASDSLEFSLIKKMKKKFGQDPHMHDLTLKFDGDDNIIHEWTLFEKGKKKDITVITLTRVQ